jgi:hypothetical protein
VQANRTQESVTLDHRLNIHTLVAEERACSAAEGDMLVFQVLLLVLGIIGGLFIATWLRRQPWDHSARVQTVVAFGAGAAAWIGFALLALSGPVVWTFIGTVLALYLPSLIALIASGSGAVDAKQDA